MVEISNQEYQRLQDASEFAESTIDTVREPLVVLDGDLKVVSASSSFYKTFKVKPEETEKQFIYNLGNNQWDIPDLRELLENILLKSECFDNYEVDHDFPGIGKRVMLLNARRIPRPPAKPRVILLAIEDISERKRIANELAKKISDLEIFFHTSMGREDRIIELKTEINALLKELGREAEYA